MKRILVIMFMALLVPSLAAAQGWNWTASADLLWTRPSINWHDDELSLRSSQKLVLVGLEASSPQLKLRYSLTTGFGMGDTITPQTALYVGSTNFGKDPTQSGQQQSQDKPVQVDWAMSPTSRIELAGPYLKGLRPLVVSELTSLTVTGTKDDNGKTKTETERLAGTFIAVGTEAAYDYGHSGGRGLVALSDNYLLADVSWRQNISGSLACKFGWQWKTLKFDKGTTVRMNGGYLGLEVLFNGL